MQRRSRISLCKLLFKYPFQSSPKPTSPFLRDSLTLLPTKLGSDSVAQFSQPAFLDTPTLKSPYLRYSTRCNAEILLPTCQNWRRYSSESGDNSVGGLDVNKEVDLINLKFAEAREEIEMAMESKETVYFDEEAECARTAVKEVLDLFDGLLGKLRESEKAALQRSMGLKIEQLKAELQQLDD